MSGIKFIQAAKKEHTILGISMVVGDLDEVFQ